MCPRGKNKLMGRINLLDFSPEFDSAVDLSCIKDSPMKNGGFNVKNKDCLCAFATKWFLTEKVKYKNIFHC